MKILNDKDAAKKVEKYTKKGLSMIVLSNGAFFPDTEKGRAACQKYTDRNKLQKFKVAGVKQTKKTSSK
jgi:hypothetical protein